ESTTCAPRTCYFAAWRRSWSGLWSCALGRRGPGYEASCGYTLSNHSGRINMCVSIESGPTVTVEKGTTQSATRVLQSLRPWGEQGRRSVRRRDLLVPASAGSAGNGDAPFSWTVEH